MEKEAISLTKLRYTEGIYYYIWKGNLYIDTMRRWELLDYREDSFIGSGPKTY